MNNSSQSGTSSKKRRTSLPISGNVISRSGDQPSHPLDYDQYPILEFPILESVAVNLG